MSNPFHNFDWSLKSIIKALGALLLAIVGISLVTLLVSFSIRTVISPFTSNYSYGGGAYPEAAMMSKSGYASDMAISTSNIMPPVPGPDGSVQVNAEAYEIKDYYVNYKKSDKTKVCATVASLKPRADVIFENSNESKYSCSYGFKVIKENAEDILQLLKDLGPEDVNSNVYTIQKYVEGLTDQLTVLKNRLDQTETALADAQTAYNELTVLATRQRDVESLTKLIDLKLNTIERLSNERLNINQQYEQIQKQKADQLERLQYVNFNVSVQESRYVDWDQIKDSWKLEIQNFVQDFNSLVQWISVKLVSYILSAAVALIYIGIAFVILKLVWLVGRKVWHVGMKKK